MESHAIAMYCTIINDFFAIYGLTLQNTPRMETFPLTITLIYTLLITHAVP